MYKVEDTVIYGMDGICRIIDIAEKSFNGSVEEYYILKPLYTNGSTIMIPTSNEMLVSRMRALLTVEEVNALIERIPHEQGIAWIDDEKKRKEMYRAIILRGDRIELIGLIKTLHAHSERQKEIGKKLHACDERVFKDAEKLLYDEFAVALNMNREDILPYIIEKSKQQEKNA